MEMTLQEARDEIEQEDAKLQFADVESMRFGSDEVGIGNRTLPVDDRFLRTFGKVAGFPTKYLKGLTPEMRTSLLQYHSNRLAERGVLDRTKVAVHGNDLVGFTSKQFPEVRVGEVLQTVAEQMSPDLTIRRLELHPSSATFTLTDANLTGTFLDASDLQYFGLTVSYDRLGLRSPGLFATAHRKGCGNTMYSNGRVTERRFQLLKKDREGVINAFSGASRDARTFITDQLIPQIRATTEHTVDPAEYLDRYVELNRIPQDVADLIFTAFRTEPGTTLYHIVQALTRAANVLPEDSRWISRLRRMGGRMTDEAQIPRCDHCLHKL
jgi:hypothetical protein